MFFNKKKRKMNPKDAVEQYNLGLAYLQGELDDNYNNDNAAYWLTKSAEQGYVEAQYRLGRQYYQPLMYREDLDWTKAVYWLEKAAEQGHVESMNILGYCFEVGGNGIKKDEYRSNYWYTIATQHGDTNSRYNLARRYLYGDVSNTDRGLEMMLELAFEGDSMAQLEAGLICLKNQECYNDGINLLRASAQQGNMLAKAKLNEMNIPVE